jgi:hypothetical protein
MMSCDVGGTFVGFGVDGVGNGVEHSIPGATFGF